MHKKLRRPELRLKEKQQKQLDCLPNKWKPKDLRWKWIKLDLRKKLKPKLGDSRLNKKRGLPKRPSKLDYKLKRTLVESRFPKKLKRPDSEQQRGYRDARLPKKQGSQRKLKKQDSGPKLREKQQKKL